MAFCRLHFADRLLSGSDLWQHVNVYGCHCHVMRFGDVYSSCVGPFMFGDVLFQCCAREQEKEAAKLEIQSGVL